MSQAKEKDCSTPPSTEGKTLLVPDEAQEDSSDSEPEEPAMSRPRGEEGDPPIISSPPVDEGAKIPPLKYIHKLSRNTDMVFLCDYISPGDFNSPLLPRQCTRGIRSCACAPFISAIQPLGL